MSIFGDHQDENIMNEVDDNDANINPAYTVLCVKMIERGAEAIDEIKYLVVDLAARNKFKQLVLDNYFELIAVLAYDGVSTMQERGKEFTVYSLISNNIDGILNNYRLKAYAQEKVITTLIVLI